LRTARLRSEYRAKARLHHPARSESLRYPKAPNEEAARSIRAFIARGVGLIYRCAAVACCDRGTVHASMRKSRPRSSADREFGFAQLQHESLLRSRAAQCLDARPRACLPRPRLRDIRKGTKIAPCKLARVDKPKLNVPVAGVIVIRLQPRCVVAPDLAPSRSASATTARR
jgi:hypothetical protein